MHYHSGTGLALESFGLHRRTLNLKTTSTRRPFPVAISLDAQNISGFTALRYTMQTPQSTLNTLFGIK
jgi:hypothetical protein